ncbi:MAG: hypothetical protein Q8K29_17485 [Polaromonas sp.]|nr:hypothetical protein [Polaromonas sp.]
MTVSATPGFFSSNGRIGALRYFIHLAWLLPVGVFFLWMPLVSLPALCMIGVLTVKRLRDCGLSKHWAWTMIIPGVNLVGIVLLIFWPKADVVSAYE